MRADESEATTSGIRAALRCTPSACIYPCLSSLRADAVVITSCSAFFQSVSVFVAMGLCGPE